MHKWLLNGCLFMVLMDEKNDDKGGGGGGGGANDDKNKPDLAKELADQKAANAALEKRLAALEGKKPDDKQTDDDLDLAKKAEAARKAKEAKTLDQSAMEAALRFSLGAKDWLKANATLLPKDIAGIFDAADKEKYDSAIEKDGAIKSAIMQDFFKVQANLDLLTSSQKSALDEFLKLTKNAKQEQAQKLYDQIFEPTFEMLKRLEKAKQLRHDGHSTSTDSDQMYKDRMIKLSRQHYLGEKANA